MKFSEVHYHRQRETLFVWDDPKVVGNYTVFYVRFNWSKNFQMPLEEVPFYMN